MRTIKHFPAIDGDLGWFELAPKHQEILGERLKGDHQFDYVIIGAGFTGLSAAHRLAELHPSAKIAVVEALLVGEGTSGRNAGFVIDVPHNTDKPNIEDDKRLYALNCFAIERLRQFKDLTGDDCQWDNAGKYLAAHETRNCARLDAFVSQLKNMGLPYQDFDAVETKKRLGTSYYQRSIYTAGTVLANPATLIRAVAKCLPKNVTLFEKSPITAWEYGDKIRLETLGGKISTGFLIEAANVFNEQFGGFKNRVGSVFTYASLTRPLNNEEIKAASLTECKPWGVTSAHWIGTTVRYTNDRRIFIRNVIKYAPNMRSNPVDLQRAFQEHRKLFSRRFPQLENVEFQYTWGGSVGITLNQDSIMKKVQPNVLVLNGCNGVGVSKGTFLGYYAAEYIDGKTSPELSFILNHSKPNWIPPEPFRSIGVYCRLKKDLWEGGKDV